VPSIQRVGSQTTVGRPARHLGMTPTNLDVVLGRCRTSWLSHPEARRLTVGHRAFVDGILASFGKLRPWQLLYLPMRSVWTTWISKLPPFSLAAASANRPTKPNIATAASVRTDTSSVYSMPGFATKFIA